LSYWPRLGGIYPTLFRFAMRRMLTATGTIFIEFQPVWIVAAIFFACVVSLLAVVALQRYDRANAFLFRGHSCLPDFPNYSMILVTTPAPTVRPPSRMANFEPCSNATGTINSTVRFTSSPGITISTPSGNSMLPVTSIVRM